MKFHLAWIRVTATAAILGGIGVQPSAAQYAPYRPMPQPVTPAAPATPRVAAQQPYWQQAAQQTQSPTPQAPAAPPATAAQYPQAAQVYVPPATAMPAYSPTPAYAPSTPAYSQAAPAYQPVQPYAPASAYTPTAAQYQPYPRVAYQQPEASAAPSAPEAEGTMPAPAKPEAPANGPPANGTNGQAQNGAVLNGPMYNGQSMPSYMGNCNCSTNGYPAGSYYTGDQACGHGYGLGDYFDDGGHDSQWFGGVYYLFMERDRPSPQRMTVNVIDSATFPYFPHSGTTALVNSDHDFRSGVEVRFGSTFTISDGCETCDTGCTTGCNTGCGSCNTGCNSCGSCCPPTVYAWEFAWWGLDDDANDVTYVPQTGYGIYGMVNFAGIAYDRDGTAGPAVGAPVNGYYGYALPIPAASDEILAQRVRTNFKAQNLELNIIRFPICNMSCGGCNSGCDSGCSTGCDQCGCEPACAPMAFSMYGSCGVRYFRADDDFMYATEFIGGGAQTAFDGWSYDVDNELYYDVQVENNLLGPQLGWTMNYCYCKWNIFMNSTFGVFDNHIEQNQRMWSGGGGRVYFSGSNEDFDVSSDKDDIAFLGELRVGGSYDFSCHWRGVLAYRAVALTGIANSTDQIASDFTSSEWVEIIDSDNSMIVHGVQTGVECRY
jgi:hypothetical protein